MNYNKENKMKWQPKSAAILFVRLSFRVAFPCCMVV
nr:MAG TPA: hypothetical protein [Bacteriophage sp.]